MMNFAQGSLDRIQTEFFFNFIVFNSKTFQKWLDIHDNVQYETVVLMQADANAFFKII